MSKVSRNVNVHLLFVTSASLSLSVDYTKFTYHVLARIPPTGLCPHAGFPSVFPRVSMSALLVSVTVATASHKSCLYTPFSYPVNQQRSCPHERLHFFSSSCLVYGGTIITNPSLLNQSQDLSNCRIMSVLSQRTTLQL